MNAEISRKITAAVICGSLMDRVTEENPKLPLMRVYGVASGVKTGKTQYGEWFGLTGRFEAVNLETGETTVAPVCILPEPTGSVFYDRVNAGESVQFALEIGIKSDAKSKTKYVFTTTSIVEETADDPLAALRDQVKALSLPAPAGDKGADKGKGKGSK